MSIKIEKIKEIREELDLSQIIVFGISFDGQQHVATHGKTKVDSKLAAEAGNSLKKVLQWPKDLCNSKPLERKCKNCSFWQQNYHRPGDPIDHPFHGKCLFEPSKVNRDENDIACGHFEPNC